MFPKDHRRLAVYEVTELGDLCCDCFIPDQPWVPAPVGIEVGADLDDFRTYARPKTGSPISKMSLMRAFDWFGAFLCEHQWELDNFAVDRPFGDDWEPKAGMAAPKCRFCGAERELDCVDELIDENDEDQPEEEYMLPVGLVRHESECPFTLWAQTMMDVSDVSQAFMDSYPATAERMREQRCREMWARPKKGDKEEEANEE